MEIYDVRDLLMGTVRLVQYTEDGDDFHDIYVGEAEDLPEKFDDLEICTIEGGHNDTVVIFLSYDEEDPEDEEDIEEIDLGDWDDEDIPEDDLEDIFDELTDEEAY